MPKYLVLPKIGMNMEEGTIAEWLVKPGDTVVKDQIVVRAETDKSVQDIFATESGKIYKLLAQPGDTVPCQGRIAVVLEDGEQYAESEEKSGTAPSREPEKPEEGQPAAPRAAVSAEGKRLRISPLARKMARELGIPEEKLKPAVEGNRIVKEDILRIHAEMKENTAAAKEAAPEMTFVPYSHMRKVIARHMRESVQNKPRVSLQCSVDCRNMIEFRNRLKVKQKVGYNEIIAKACAQALSRHPEMNVISAEDGFYQMEHVNISVAVDTPRGLLTPVLRDVDKKGIFRIAEDFAEIVDRAKEGKLSADEMSGGTFSVTNLGMFGVESFNPIVNSPECFILGVGCMKDTPVALDNAVCIRPIMQISLNFDHAAFDGAAAAKLLSEIKEMLEYPEMMLA